ncbi:UPF0496 protein 3 [Spatholobus suberectus]|nr:UPF0496 protein 3 [Spatholobus suberectus]
MVVGQRTDVDRVEEAGRVKFVGRTIKFFLGSINQDVSKIKSLENQYSRYICLKGYMEKAWYLLFVQIASYPFPSHVQERRDAPQSINFHEEYHRTLRTKSYVDFFNKVQLLANQPSINYNHSKFSEILLEPCQETISSIVDSATLSRTPELKNLMLSYFDISAEASHICSHLLKSINQVHSNYQVIQRALDIKDGDSLETSELIIFELKTHSPTQMTHFQTLETKTSSSSMISTHQYCTI